MPSWARSKRRIAANDKANIAFIGIGNYGAQNLTELARENIVAVCDVDWRTRAQLPGRGGLASEVAAKYPQAKRFDDWRIMLESMDRQIDAVVVCTADHVHAVAAITAMKMGKHVYCEKPLAHTIGQVRAMTAAAHKYPQQATQTGIVGHASEDVRRIVEWVRDGAIGKIEKIDVWQSDWTAGQRYTSPYDEIAHVQDQVVVPAEVKWDLWLGPAPERPYNPMYLPLRWRNWLDFGTGILGDHGPHFMDPVIWALDLGYPDEISADTDPGYVGAARQQMFARYSHVNYHFPAKGARAAVPLKWYGYATPEIPKGWNKSEPFPTGGGILHGTKGTLVFGPVYNSKPGAPKQVWLLPEEVDREYKRPDATIARPQSHWLEWIDAARDGKQPSANWQYGGLVTEICLLGNIAIQHAGTTLRFDPKSRSFTNSAAANSMFDHGTRARWKLPT
ncbi:Gfo/Idh/MocA family oxidoreductase [Granulicella sp. dw_53]|uniref:Gfo/Idh/MocA family protein n=1 Tax=Granulicella sp. dw_53 TaxID=2719792 RepID=UPI001BD31752